MKRTLFFTAVRVKATDDLTGGDEIYILVGTTRINIPGKHDASDDWVALDNSYLDFTVELSPQVTFFTVYESDHSGDDLIGQISIPEGDGSFEQEVSNGDAVYEIAFTLATKIP